MKYIAASLWGSVETAAAGEAHPIWFENCPQTDVNGNINGAIELREDCFFCGGFVQNGSGFFMRGGDAFYGSLGRLYGDCG